MVESVTNLANEELLARIAKLEAGVARLSEQAQTEKAQMLGRIERIAAKVSDLHDFVLMVSKEVLAKREWWKDAFDRIMNIEMFVFPNLVSDLQAVHRIIGLEDDTRATENSTSPPLSGNNSGSA